MNYAFRNEKMYVGVCLDRERLIKALQSDRTREIDMFFLY